VVFGWKMINASHGRLPGVAYSTFLQIVDAGDVQKLSIYMGYRVADLQFTGRDHSVVRWTEVSTKDLPSMIKRLLEAGVAMDFANARRMEPSELTLDLLPFILIPIVLVYFYYARRRTRA
jgi:ATP-dependent Zn protease